MTRAGNVLADIFLISMVLFGPSIRPAAQNYYFKTIDREDGLSHNMVYDIMQDHQGFIWVATQKGLNRYDGKSFKVFRKEPKLENGLTSNSFFTMAQDKEGIIWIGTDDGLFTYNPDNEMFTDIELRDRTGSKIKGAVRSMVIDKSENVWIAMSDTCVFRMSVERRGTCWPFTRELSPGSQIRSLGVGPDNCVWVASSEDGLMRLNPDIGEIRHYHNEISDNLSTLCLVDNEILLMGTSDKGVLKFNIRHQYFEGLDKAVSKDGVYVHDIFKDSKDNLWIGTETGIYLLSQDGTTHFHHVANDRYSLAGDAVFSITEDREGGIWIGTFFGGVSYYSEYSSQFEKYYPSAGPGRLSGQNVSPFQSDGSGGLWVGTEDGGLNYFDSSTKTFSTVDLPSRNIHALAMVDDKLWIGTYGDGLFQLDPVVNKFRKLNTPLSLTEDNIYSIHQDYSGRVWVGTDHGIYKSDHGREPFVRMNPNNITTHVCDIVEDFNGNLWFATLGEGVFRYDCVNNIWQNTTFDTGNDSYGGKNIICFLEDKDHNIWIGTDGAGMYFLDNSKNVVTKHLTVTNGLPDGVVNALVQDANGYIWGSTNHGIFRLDPSTDNIQGFNMESGLLYDQLNPNSGYLTEDGKICFGGVEGFTSFNPLTIKLPNHPSSLIFNYFQLFNNDIAFGDKDYPIQKSITCAKEIVLKPGQDAFSIGFTDLVYAPSPDIRYSYRLAGLDKDWIDIPKPQEVTYSRLPVGNYTFEIKAHNPKDSAGDDIKSIGIKVLPPFYKSGTAKILYAFFLLILCGLIALYLVEKIRRKNKAVYKEMEEEKKKELYDSKIEFFTNITHEIRTPLTLITVPLNDVLEHTDKGSPEYNKLSIVKRNSDRLLKLVNELLDFKKIGSEDLHLNFTSTNVSNLLQETVSRFEPSANANGVSLSLGLPDKDVIADIDREIVTKILSNLLSNACKHARARIDVRLFKDNDRLNVEIGNDGEAIQENQAERIFDPFVKIDPGSKGSGIGLPFARNLAESHGGRLTLESTAKPVTFLLDIPMRQAGSVSLAPAAQEEPGQDIPKEGMDMARHTILLVDDNVEFLEFMKEHLADSYNILTAVNGKEGLELLSPGKVDLIICDLMMPVMDGVEMTKAVKSDIDYSHIPVIMLTAKTDMQSKIEGLNVGADEYITKPFSSDYLKARIENLLNMRARILEAYKHTPDLSVQAITHSPTDERFMNRLTEVINASIEDSNLNVDEIASAMAMSRATLYRKVKSVSELTPNDFIRLCRLKKAAQLLREKEYKVNEVSYIVGFSSPSYFSKCFFKQFGVLPKDYG